VAIHELNDEQIRTWTLEEKDEWWLKNVYRGNMPQLTIRSAITGMILGGVLSLTNIYIGAKTGWTMGVGVTSVILAFAMFKVLSRFNMTSEFTILENNAMQSIATAAGYMTSPLISSLAAYMMVTGEVIPMWQTFPWMIMLAVLGVLFAFPFKRRFINDEQQPFPEGRAAGIVMDALHHGQAAAGMLKAKLLVIFAGIAALVKLLQSETIMTFIHLQFLKIPEFLDGWLYDKNGKGGPKIGNTSLLSLTVRPELDLALVGAGGLMGIRTGLSLLVGASINYLILAPAMIQLGDIPSIDDGTNGFRKITFWSLWGGVAMMTAASLLVFFSKPQMLVGAFRKLFQKRADSAGVLDNVELPLKVSAIGIPVVGLAVILMAWSFFGVEPWFGVIALVLVFAFALIAINSTGMTSITPIGAMGKLTQLTFGVLAPRNPTTNLATAAICGEVASHSANLLQDIKPGYMLGAKPRQQALGHVLGVVAGSLLAIPVFYLVFLKHNDSNKFEMDFATYPMPAATLWHAVAELLTKGLSTIKESARWMALMGVVWGVILEWARLRTKNRFPLSPLAIGLGFIVPFSQCFAMFLGGFAFWLIEQRYPSKDDNMNQVIVQNQEPISAGLVAGGALMGIVVAIADLFA
jgi:OPT family oligopeptide transporter